MSFSGIRRAAAWLCGPTFLLVALATGSAQPSLPPSPARKWKTTDTWKVAVEVFQVADGKPVSVKPVKVFPGEITLVSPGLDQGGPSWNVLRFEASGDAPDEVRRIPCFAWVEMNKGWLSKATRTDPINAVPLDLNIARVAEAALLAEPSVPMPLDMVFPNLPARTITDPNTQVEMEVRRTQASKSVVMEAILRAPGKDEIRVEQSWEQGEKWWRETKRFVNGRMILRAKVTATESREKMEQWLREDINLFLTDDDRLGAKVTIVRDNPTVQDLLGEVRKATGVRCTLDPKLEDYRPALGSVQMREAPAWVILKFIASQGFNNAQWEHFDDGYRLKPGGPLPPPPPKSGDWTVTSVALLTGGVLVVVLLILSALAIWRRGGVVGAGG